MSIIQLENVIKTYQIGEVVTHAVNGVDLTIEPGEFTAIVGPSGSGKTTMLQLMGCLDKPDSGRILLNGEDVTRAGAGHRADLRREEIGFIFQFFALVPVLSAYENVELPLLLNGTGAKARKERVLELLDAVGLADRAKHRPDQLSGGQQQRAAIARALATNPCSSWPTVSTANLDTENGKQAMDTAAAQRADGYTALIFATHDPRVMPTAPGRAHGRRQDRSGRGWCRRKSCPSRSLPRQTSPSRSRKGKTMSYRVRVYARACSAPCSSSPPATPRPSRIRHARDACACHSAQRRDGGCAHGYGGAGASCFSFAVSPAAPTPWTWPWATCGDAGAPLIRLEQTDGRRSGGGAALFKAQAARHRSGRRPLLPKSRLRRPN
ncbi:MAG: ABC transporter ATP-binding protein [Caldilineaceae bacterium]